MAKITVQNTPITVIGVDGDDYISLTDMAKSQLQEHINCTEFGAIKNAAGSDNDRKLLK